MKAALYSLVIFLTLGVLASCGGSSSSTPSVPVTGIKKRALVSNAYNGTLVIVDAGNDRCIYQGVIVSCGSAPSISASSGASAMTVSKDLTTTLVLGGNRHAGTGSITVIDNATEKATGGIALLGWTDNVLISGDDKTAWAPVRNANVGSGQPLGSLAVADLTAFSETDVAIPAARRAFLSHNGSKIIVLPDTTTDPSIANNVWIYDTAAKTVTGPIAGFDHPAYAAFSSDDSKAYILNCGPECGGTTAGVNVLDMATNTPGIITPVAGGATVGLLDSSTLYVAGNAGNTGTLTLVDVSGAVPVAGTSVSISDGWHASMALASNSKLFIGATSCTNPAKSCLTIFDTSAKTAKDVFNTAQPNLGDVTGLQPISDRSVVYVIEGGELYVYDTTTSDRTSASLDIVGQAVDVKQIDP